jgi:hypothetical protein
MPQGVLPFKYEKEKSDTGMTSLGGLPIYLDLAHKGGLDRLIDDHVGIKRESQGWRDSEVVMSLVLLNLAGGESVEDLNWLEGDEGLGRILDKWRLYGARGKKRKEMESRWRKERKRSLPSPSSVFRYLSAFHDSEQEKLREDGKAFIPLSNGYLRGLGKVNRDFISFVQNLKEEETATLDMDATLVETNKEEAFFCYKSFKSYQPLNTWWWEQGLVLHTEFRDGNVPAGHEQLRVFKEALECLPERIKSVRLRSDTAGYQHNLLRYCDLGDNERFGRIEFAIGCDVTSEFKKAVDEVEGSEWKVLKKEAGGKMVETNREYAEVCFVPSAIARSKKGPEYRYIAIREGMEEQLSFDGMEDEKEYPFQTLRMGGVKYKVFGIVTNMDWEGRELIPWFYKRCGKSEEAHSVMKEDLAGGKLPSGDFGENAAWWWIMILAFNLNAAMKSLVLGKSWMSRRMKAIRFSLINLPARVMERSREMFLRLSKDHLAFRWLLEIRRRIAGLAAGPSG